MKAIFRSILTVCLAVHACASLRGEDGPGLTISSATFGTQENRIDALRPLIAHDCLLLRAKWGLGDQDPAPGVVKDLQIVFSFNGTRQTVAFRQDQDILLLPDPAAFTIVSASFGAGDRRVDVTGAVRAAMVDGSLHMWQGWEFGRVDPVFGKVKTVEIIYVDAGVLKTATFNPHEEINLPQPADTKPGAKP